MTDLAKALTGLSALAFVLAVLFNYGEYLPEWPVLAFPTATAEGFSRASSNLALLAIALVLCFRESRSA